MNLYLVTNPTGQTIWVAYEDEEARIWSYVQNTGKFHRNNGLYLDFFFDHTNTYAPITPEAAERAIDEGVGKLDARVLKHMVTKFKEDPDAMTTEDVLGSKPAFTLISLTEDRVRDLETAKPGEWLTWKRYPIGQKQRAFSAASSIRAKKLKALQQFGDLDVRVKEADGQVTVQVARRTA